jgi:hypothetical protein
MWDGFNRASSSSRRHQQQKRQLCCLNSIKYSSFSVDEILNNYYLKNALAKTTQRVQQLQVKNYIALSKCKVGQD